MPVHSITVTDTYVEIERGIGDVLHFDFADFPPSASTDSARGQHILDLGQSWLDTRIKLNQLPADDPYQNLAVEDDHLFYEGQGGNKTIVIRHIVLENVVYDSGASPPLRFTLRRIWPI